MRAMRAVSAMGAMGFALMCTTLGASRMGNGIQLTVLFDGGFVYSKTSTQLLVGTVDTAMHPLKVRQITGTGLSGDLEIAGGRALRMLPDGGDVLETLPGVPGYDPTQVGCHDKDQLPGWRNNMLFVPSLQEAARVMGGATTVKQDIPYDGHIVLTGGGALSIRRLGGCVALKDAAGAEVSKKSMVAGVAGIAYTWVIPAASTLRLQRTLGAAVDTYDLRPTDGAITLHVSSTFGSGEPAQPGEIAHFRHFHRVYDHYDAAKQPKLYWVESYSTTPGDYCPPVTRWP